MSLNKTLSAVNRVSLWLAIACIVGLVVGIIVEMVEHVLLFDGYLSAFSGWMFVFAIINALTRRATKERSNNSP